MKQMWLTKFPMMSLPLIGMFIFLSVFLCVVYWVLKPSNRKHFEESAQLVFEKGDQNESI